MTEAPVEVGKVAIVTGCLGRGRIGVSGGRNP
jgi:hypothetical protein